MCGIAGFCSLKRCYTDRQSFWENILVSMHEKLIHRGGDASGIYLTPHAGLSHQRLSIRDITHGAQPMIVTGTGQIMPSSTMGRSIIPMN